MLPGLTTHFPPSQEASERALAKDDPGSKEHCRVLSMMVQKLISQGAIAEAKDYLITGVAFNCVAAMFGLGWITLNDGRIDAIHDAVKYFRMYVKAFRAPGADVEPHGAMSQAMTLKLDKEVDPWRKASVVSLTHAKEQLEYLIDEELVDENEYGDELKAYDVILRKMPKGKQLSVDLNPTDAAKIPNYRRLYFPDDRPVFLASPLSPRSDHERIAQRYHDDSIVILDDVLRPDVLKALYEYAMRATVFYDAKARGYVGAYLEEGFNAPLLLQVGEALREMLPTVFNGSGLKQVWAYNYDDTEQHGIGVHGDDYAVNCNLWLTPDRANANKSSGGLVVYTKPVPLDWNFADFNRMENVDKVEAYLADSNTVTVPYKQNRMVLFKSDLFHRTDRFNFRRG